MLVIRTAFTDHKSMSSEWLNNSSVPNGQLERTQKGVVRAKLLKNIIFSCGIFPCPEGFIHAVPWAFLSSLFDILKSRTFKVHFLRIPSICPYRLTVFTNRIVAQRFNFPSCLFLKIRFSLKLARVMIHWQPISRRVL